MTRTLCALLLLVTACSDSSGPEPINMAGAWALNVSNLTGGSFTCSVTNTTLALNQTGTTFTGSYIGGQMRCDGSLLGTLSGVVNNGTVSGTNVQFDFDTPDIRFSGSVSGNTASGTVAMRVVVSGQAMPFTGSWAATRN